MLRRPAALLGFSITTRNLISLSRFHFPPNSPSCTPLHLSSSSKAVYRSRIRFRVMSASMNSTSVNEKDEQLFQDFKLLNAVNDRYGGVIVEVREPMDSARRVRTWRKNMSGMAFWLSPLVRVSPNWKEKSRFPPDEGRPPQTKPQFAGANRSKKTYDFGRVEYYNR